MSIVLVFVGFMPHIMLHQFKVCHGGKMKQISNALPLQHNVRRLIWYGVAQHDNTRKHSRHRLMP